MKISLVTCSTCTCHMYMCLRAPHSHITSLVTHLVTSMWVSNALLSESFDPMRGQCLSVKTSVEPAEQLVIVESTSFHEVSCDASHEGELRFTYIY